MGDQRHGASIATSVADYLSGAGRLRYRGRALGRYSTDRDPFSRAKNQAKIECGTRKHMYTRNSTAHRWRPQSDATPSGTSSRYVRSATQLRDLNPLYKDLIRTRGIDDIQSDEQLDQTQYEPDTNNSTEDNESDVEDTTPDQTDNAKISTERRNKARYRYELQKIAGRAHASGQRRARCVTNKLTERHKIPAIPAPRAEAGLPRSLRTNKPEVVGLFEVLNDLRKRRLAPKCPRDTRDYTRTRQADKRGIRSAIAWEHRFIKHKEKKKFHRRNYRAYKAETENQQRVTKLHKGGAGPTASYQTAPEVRRNTTCTKHREKRDNNDKDHARTREMYNMLRGKQEANMSKWKQQKKEKRNQIRDAHKSDTEVTLKSRHGTAEELIG